MKAGHLILIGAFAAAAAAPAMAQDTPKKGGALNYAIGAEPPNYDCHGQTSFAAIQPLAPHYSTLLKFDAANYPKIVPDVAASYEVSTDSLTYSFKLKPNVKFHDGSALTSADIKATYQRIIDPPKGVVSARQASFEAVAGIETPDPLTVVFKMKKPDVSMLANFASPWNCIYSAAKLQADQEFPKKNIMGTGPFTFTEHVAGSHWAGKRFDGYFVAGQPYLDSFRAVFIGGAAMINALQGGQILAEFRGQTPAERDKLVQALGDKVKVQESAWICTLNVIFNTEKKPFDDVRVRKALTLAIDRWQGSQALQRIALVREVGGVLRPGYELAASNDELAKLPGLGKDINAARAEARELLKQAGVERLRFGFTNRNVAMPYTPVGVFAIDQWRQIGVTAEHRQLETRLFQNALSSGDFEVGLDFACDFMDEPNVLLIKYISADKTSVNYGRYTDRKLDELFDKQSAATDPKQRYAILREFESHLLNQAYIAPMIWWHRIIVHHANLRGWDITPSHYVNQDLASVWLAN